MTTDKRLDALRQAINSTREHIAPLGRSVEGGKLKEQQCQQIVDLCRAGAFVLQRLEADAGYLAACLRTGRKPQAKRTWHR